MVNADVNWFCFWSTSSASFFLSFFKSSLIFHVLVFTLIYLFLFLDSVFFIYSEWQVLETVKFEFYLKKKIRDILRHYSKITSPLQFAFFCYSIFGKTKVWHIYYSLCLWKFFFCIALVSSVLLFFLLFFFFAWKLLCLGSACCVPTGGSYLEALKSQGNLLEIGLEKTVRFKRRYMPHSWW